LKSVSRSVVTLGLGLLLGSSVMVESAQADNDWYLIHGAATGGRGVYPASPGMPGQPGARRYAATWTDSQGRLWMFGGSGYAETPNGPSSLSDIWMYDPGANSWYWMGGDKVASVTPTYPGTVGQAGVIGARFSCTFWKDSADNLWVFGGYGRNTQGGEGFLSDMWKLNTQTMTWTFEGGSQTPNDNGDYRGINQTGRPAARRDGAGGVTADGDFLLFGGAGPANASRNDLWRFTPATRTWTWLAGPGSTGAAGLYPPFPGQEGHPGARYGMAYYMETFPFHTLWIFGGYGYTGSDMGLLNDLWRYEVNSNKFYWVAGSSFTVQSTVYPEQHGQTGTLGARNGPLFWYADHRFWISGGYGIASTGYGRFNDLWSFQRMEAVWRFADGPKGQTEGSYPSPGQKGLPLGRMNAQTWTSGNRMYLFGGSPDGASVLSDFWFHHAASNASIIDWQLLED
jgi:N-acetylneuraminic acid mutarotase